MVRVHLFIEGKVQGVFYRDSTRTKAEELGVNGWVRNLTDGRVEAVFEGPGPKVKEMVAWCRRGPPMAQVTGLAELDGEREEGLRGFEVRKTADARGLTQGH